MAAGVECPKGTSSRFALGRPLASGGDSDETRLRYHKGPPPRPKSEPSKAGPIWKGGATKRYKVFGASPQTDAGNIVSAVCSDAVVPAAGVEPARVISPTDFESVTSANSITPACAFHITISSRRLQALFRDRGKPVFPGTRRICKGPRSSSPRTAPALHKHHVSTHPGEREYRSAASYHIPREGTRRAAVGACYNIPREG